MQNLKNDPSPAAGTGPAGPLRLARNAPVRVTLTLNGCERSAWCEPRTLLSDFLRHDLGATGTHVGCEHGVCGACTVQVDGVAARSCLMLAVQADRRAVGTVEGLAARSGTGAPEDESLTDLQEAFRRNHALQCGFCTAGILMSCDDFLKRVPHPDEVQVREMLSGHLCRCTGYTNIVTAVLQTAQSRGQDPEAPSAPTGAAANAPGPSSADLPGQPQSRQP